MAEEEQEWHLIDTENYNAPIVVLCEPTTHGAYNRGDVMHRAAFDLFRTFAIQNGMSPEDFAFISVAPPLTDEAKASDGRTNKYVLEFREEMVLRMQQYEKAKLVIYYGKMAGCSLMGKAVKINEHRGQIHKEDPVLGVPFLPLFSPNHVLQRPQVRDIYESDFRLAKVFEENDWDWETFNSSMMTGDYRWVTDLQFLLDEPPKAIAVDTETRGYKWYDGCRILCVQISYAKNKAVCVPIDIAYWNDPERIDESSAHLPRLDGRLRQKIINQLKQLLNHPDVYVGGHNLKFDLHAFLNHGITVRNWAHDTMQLAFVVDDNMERKGLDDCVRRWIPDMAGYADEFNSQTDKSRMWDVNHRDMMNYGCGDADVTRRLMFRLMALGKADAANWRCYTKIQMPSLRTFFRMERKGLQVNTEALYNLGEVAKTQQRQLWEELVGQIDGGIKREYLEEADQRKPLEKQLNLGSAALVNDWLFLDERGLCLEPKVFTKTTRKLAPEERVPSTSSKDHLPYFEHLDPVAKLIDYKKISKLTSTYIGEPLTVEHIPVKVLKSGNKFAKAAQDILEAEGLIDECSFDLPQGNDPDFGGETPAGIGPEGATKTIVLDVNGFPWWRTVHPPTGFWKYLSPSNYIHPSFFLHRTVTGRSASADPNGQNIPKRGRTPMMKQLVKAYRRIFVAPPGWKLIECDLSQAELRLTAWRAKDRRMLKIYREGGDIHAATAMATMGLSQAQWDALPDDERDLARFRAKAVNFGFIYGMGGTKYVGYAKCEYGIDVTEEEAWNIRNLFFANYAQLQQWHQEQRRKAKKGRAVRALHGALRRLPAVESSEDYIQGEAMRQAINSEIQRFASDLGLMGMNRFARDCPWDKFHPVAFIHDAVVALAREEHVEEAMSSLKWYMQTPPLKKWFNLYSPLPLLADIQMGDNLGEMEELDIEAKCPEWYTHD